jgi:site-specific DNA-adenine methylase
MFSYFGSKSKIVKLYPTPQQDKIIEVFAGSARYALEYFEKEVTIIDKYDKVVAIWEYLKSASEKDILGLPGIRNKQKLSEILNISDAERSLIYFCSARGNGYVGSISGDFNGWERDKKRIAESLYKIRHWEILSGEYDQVANQKATWFVDPPYQVVTRRNYKHSDIDYHKLGEFCKERDGQCIVCENDKADWLPFVELSKMNGLVKKTTETIWTNNDVT